MAVLGDADFFDRYRWKLRRVMDTSLGNLDYLPSDHFGNGVVAIHKANDSQRLLVCRF
jgi:hypothetical protein